ncbi:DUF3999 domain-containing protein [Iodobacter fluviatilis]|uniref:DUF3999 domain-containing protein n=1 Tax=Iodobacter fluviatilis TaxID=537 RepID=A0A7G3G4L1_9NEIS|nr:DUF3999 domain-containing protein [Iodobacter fluviatilis]QBC42360.1 hypothetical protein C1H71_01480 [Iodobacter fluviatilis]
MRRMLILLLCISPLTLAKKLTPTPLPAILTSSLFSHQQALIIKETAPFYRLDLPISVYQFSQDADLGDLRVFNAAGEVVPYAFISPKPSIQSAQTALRFFPYSNTQLSQQISVQVHSNGQLSAQTSSASSSQSSYIVDASQIQGRFETLALSWQESNYQSQIKLAVSDDLKSWQELGSTALVQLDYQGQVLKQAKIDLTGVQAKYLRLNPETPLTLTQALLQYSTQDAPIAHRIWLTPIVATASQQGEYLFDLGLHAPIDRVQLALPQLNTVAEVSLSSSANPKGPWQSVQNMIVYRLANSESPSIEISPNNHRYWQLQVKQNGGGLGQGMPKLKVGWLAQQIAFAARGEAPFTLAFGNIQIQNAAMQAQDLIIGKQIAPATAGVLLNKVAITTTIASAPSPARTYGLWAALVLAVTVLGTMAWKLLQQTKKL